MLRERREQCATSCHTVKFQFCNAGVVNEQRHLLNMATYVVLQLCFVAAS